MVGGGRRAGDSPTRPEGRAGAGKGTDRKPLLDRVVLVLGAGDPATRTLALHAAALGAALVCAGPVLPPVLETAGLAAATGGTARVIESPAPPLGGLDLARAATGVLAPPTDAVIGEAAFASPAAAQAAAASISAVLARGARVLLVPERPDGGSKAHATRVLDAWIAARTAAATLPPPDAGAPRPRPRSGAP